MGSEMCIRDRLLLLLLLLCRFLSAKPLGGVGIRPHRGADELEMALGLGRETPSVVLEIRHLSCCWYRFLASRRVEASLAAAV